MFPLVCKNVFVGLQALSSRERDTTEGLLALAKKAVGVTEEQLAQMSEASAGAPLVTVVTHSTLSKDIRSFRETLVEMVVQACYQVSSEAGATCCQ